MRPSRYVLALTLCSLFRDTRDAVCAVGSLSCADAHLLVPPPSPFHAFPSAFR